VSGSKKKREKNESLLESRIVKQAYRRLVFYFVTIQRRNRAQLGYAPLQSCRAHSRKQNDFQYK